MSLLKRSAGLTLNLKSHCRWDARASGPLRCGLPWHGRETESCISATAPALNSPMPGERRIRLADALQQVIGPASDPVVLALTTAHFSVALADLLD